MILLQAVISFCMLLCASCTVVPNPPKHNLTVFHDDIIQFNLTELFHLDYSKHPHCDVVASPATLYYPRDAYTVKDISHYEFVDEPEIVEFVTNTTFYGIFDNKNILIQSINLDAESFGPLVVQQFGTLGDESLVSDIALNTILNRIYVLGYTNPTSKLESHYIYIAELDATTGEEINLVKTLIDPSFPVQHRPQIKIANILDNGKIVPYVIVYDQGISSGVSSKNKWLMVFNRVDTGNLLFVGLVDITSTNIPLGVIYDIFPFRNQFLITGKAGDVTSPIAMAYCSLLISKFPTLSCNDAVVVAGFKTTIGYVGIMNTGQYVEIDNNPNSQTPLLSVCDFGGDFGTPKFVDFDDCAGIPSYSLATQVAVSGVEGNVHQIVVKYVHYDNTYAGFSLHNFDLKFEYQDIDDSKASHYVVLEKNLIKVTKDVMEIHRIVPPFLLIKASDLNPGKNIIRVECIDSDEQEPIQNFINFVKMDNLKDAVSFNSSSLSDFEVYEGDQHVFLIEPSNILGNDLKCNLDLGSSLTESNIYDTEKLNIDFKLDQGTENFVEIRFVGEYAIAQDNNSLIIFMRCHFVGIADILCEERAVYNAGGHDVRLMRDVNEVFHWVFAWSVDNTVNITQVYIFDGVHKVNTFLFGGVAHDVTMGEIDNQAHLVLADYTQGTLRGYNFSMSDPSRYHVLPVINRGLSGRDFFCPVDIDFDPEDEDVLEVLSVCPGQDQRILRFRYPPSYNSKTGHLQFLLITSIPINFAFQHPRYCSMGTEFVVYSTLGTSPDLRSYNLWDDLNQWTFGFLEDDLNLGTARQFNCIARAGMFSVLSTDSNQNNVLTTYFGNRQFATNGRVYTTVRQGLNGYKYAHSYELLKQVVHTLWSPTTQTYDYMLTFVRGRVAITQFKYGLGDTNLIMTLKCTNGNSQRFVETSSVKVVAAASSTSINVISKLDRRTVGIVNLDRNIRVTGATTAGSIVNNNLVEFIGRLHLQFDYEPFPEFQGVYTEFHTRGLASVGAHVDSNTNDTHFTFFHDISIFAGYAQAQHGVQSFDFTEVHGDAHQRDTIFIAYSTAEPFNNHLEFNVYRGPALIAEGRTPLGTICNFTKVRVIQSRDPTTHTFYVFAKNQYQGLLHIYQVVYDTDAETLISTELKGVSNVVEFTVVANRGSNFATLAYVTNQDNHDVFFQQFKIDGDETVAARSEILKMPRGSKFRSVADPTYKIKTIEAKPHNDTHFFLLIDADSVHIYELIFDSNNIKAFIQAEFLYNKMPGFDGWWLDGNNRHIVHLVYNRKAESQYVFYKRQLADTFATGDPVWTQPTDTPRPFGVTNGRTNTSVFLQTTGSASNPVNFFSVGSAQLNIKEGADLTQGSLVINGLPNTPPSKLNIIDLFSSNQESGEVVQKKERNWWPVKMIATIFISIAGFIALRSLTK